MDPNISGDYSTCVIGLGYVGLPLALCLAKKFTKKCYGYDIFERRVKEIRDDKIDSNDEVSTEELKETTLICTYDPNDVKGLDIYIIAVPTPASKGKPDLRPLRSVSKTLGTLVKKGSIVCFESTVYPGVTEQICGPIIEEVSKLKCGVDFFLGYSPERINPGDKVHRVDNICKVVAGQTKEVAKILERMYGCVNGNRIHVAPSIMVAEGAKLIENVQRDANIAIMNEIAIVFKKLGMSTYEVLEAAKTKWNFLDFRPGLVGGHCISVDPWYFVEVANQVGVTPFVVKGCRDRNDEMKNMLADEIIKFHKTGVKDGKVDGTNNDCLVLGITYKENVVDTRNTQIPDFVKRVKDSGYKCDVYDPFADPEYVKFKFGIDLVPKLGEKKYDLCICVVAHHQFSDFKLEDFEMILKNDTPCVLADIKNIWKDKEIPKNSKLWKI